MCLEKRTIYNPAKRLFRNRYTQYLLRINCGECTECRRDKANEMRVRTYYEYLDTIKKGGFALWDRLSYTDETLPHLAKVANNVPDRLDFTCFKRKDLQDFLKRLRENLKNRGIDTKDNLKYLIAAEYGQEEDRYISDKGYWREATLRPHYHAIFYYKNDNLNPTTLSMEIKKAWKLGKTNGIEDNPTYFTDKGKITTIEDALTVSDYLGKYCLKNQDYDKVAKYKIKELVRYYRAMEKGINTEDLEDKELKKKRNRDEIAKLLREVKTFHFQSHHYGETAIYEQNAIKDGNLIGMPDKKKIKWWQKLPMYYTRKLYYNYTRTKEGKVIWYLNEAGKAWKLKNIEKTIETTAQKLQEKETALRSPNFIELIQNYITDNELEYSAKETWERLNDLEFAYKNGRTWKHYATYMIWHKGRISDGRMNYEPDWTIELNQKASLEAEYSNEPMYYNYITQTDIDHFKTKMVGPEDLGDKWKGYKKRSGKEIKPTTFTSLYCINENSMKQWENYDKLTDILNIIDNYIEHTNKIHEKTNKHTELTWKGQQKTLYKNILL